MTAAPAPARLPRPVLPAIPDAGRGRTAGPGAAQTSALVACLDVLRGDQDARTRLQQALDVLPRLVPGCDHASAASGRHGGGPDGGASDAVARRADALQDELDEGPGLHALRTGHSVIVHDLETEERWPRWCDRASAGLRLGSALAVVLTVGRRTSGTLTLYGDRPGRLSDVDLGLLHTLAAPIAGVQAALRTGG
ncbi:GAF domain-containing protein [Microlunatus flavus]|uniref:GAF domain-containing protein n=1 Tax=Microlunatus flavus TaxID=1036181 RepID=A0A1H9N448_9ACTN|nr:GAF domain-containing protein [Microlunatus flavus]SER30648.1 GAF domain-containing protein [Microlunatus flavus]